MREQATPSERLSTRAHSVALDIAVRHEMRTEGLVYTAVGILDMSRIRSTPRPDPERIVLWID